MSWFSDAWDAAKSFAKAHPVLVSTVAAVATFVAVAAVVAVAAPVIAAAAGVVLTAGAVTAISVGTAGVVSGVVGYLVGQGLTDQPVTASGLVVNGVLSGVISLATLGLGNVLAPVVSRGVAPIVVRATTSAGLSEATTIAATRVVTNGGVGGILGAGTKIVENAIDHKPLFDGVPQATATGIGLGVAMDPIQRLANNAVSRATGLPAPGTEPVRPVAKPEPPTVPRYPPADPVIAARGAGAQNPELQPGYGGVEPLSPITGQSRTNLDGWNEVIDAFKQPEPRVLTEAELAQLADGRGSPSGTIKAGDAVDLENWNNAARKVNDLVRSGEDLSLDRITELNKTLLQGTSNDAKAGVLRSETGDHVGHGGSNAKDFPGNFFEYASPETIPTRLQEFMQWYQANEGTMSPTELAAQAYQQLVRIHPFTDSNGRTTRLVMDWILQRNGLPPATFSGISHEAVHSPTDMLVYNVDRAVIQANQTLTHTSDTTAVPGVTLKTGANAGGGTPAKTDGFVGALGGDN